MWHGETMEARAVIAEEQPRKLGQATVVGIDIGSRQAKAVPSATQRRADPAAVAVNGPRGSHRGRDPLPAEAQPLVAVVSRDGETAALTPNVPAWVLVFSAAEGRLHLVEKRRIEVRPTDFSRPGWQIEHLRVILHAVRGCKTLVLSRITMPQRLLIEARGIRVLEAGGFVEEALTEVAALGAAASQPTIQAWPQYRR